MAGRERHLQFGGHYAEEFRVGLNDRRAEELDTRLGVWGPLIGREATITAMTGLRWYRRGLEIYALAVIWELSVVLAGGTTWLWLLGLSVGGPLVVVCLVYGVRLDLKAQRQAALVAGTSPKARPPVRNLKSFRRWQAESHYARAAMLSDQ